MRSYPRVKDHPEAVVKVLLTVIEKTPSGGATLEDLKDAYRQVKGHAPSKKAIDRIIRRLNLLFDPLAYGERREPGEPDGCTDSNEDPQAQPRAIQATKKDGQVRYIFTRELAVRPIEPDLAFLMALSLYPQQRGLLSGHFEVVMELVFEAILRRLAVYYNLLRETEKYVFVSGFEPVKPEMRHRMIKELLRALRHQKPVKMEYVRASDGQVSTREVEPYGLLCRFNNWYLVGRCCKELERRVFLVDHIRSLRVVENRGIVIPRDFDLRETYGKSWGVWTEEDPGEPETVRLRVARGLAEKFKVTRYHDSQQIKELEDGRVEVTYTVAGAREMIPWLMTWGASLKVLEPAWLREALADNLRDTLALYR